MIDLDKDELLAVLKMYDPFEDDIALDGIERDYLVQLIEKDLM